MRSIPEKELSTQMSETNWDATYDVVVIGSGFAGLAAAIEARLLGASVLVLEKMRIPGGNSAISGGLIAAAGSPLQQRDEISDSPEQMLQDMVKAGEELNHPDLAGLIARESTNTLKWTQEFLGVEYKDRLNHLGGHSVPRTYNTANASGSGLLRPMLAKCRELGVKVQLKSFFRKFVVDASERVSGVEIIEDYLFPHEDSGQVRRIGARRGVVLASGGFSRDVAFRRIQMPRLDEQIDSTNHLGATAEGLVAALRIGATPVHLSCIQLGPWCSGDEKGWGVGSMFSLLAGFPYGIMVDAATGQRFVNELSDRKLRVDAMLARDRIPLAIVDSEGVQFAANLDKCLKRGVVKKFNSLTELAAANQVPLAPLEETITRYNRSFLKGRDEEFGKPLGKDLKPLQTPPYYAIRLLPKVHHCMGGIQINEHGQALEVATHQPIPGLYAAGEVTGGPHGNNRLGSVAIVDCLVFGRIAGRNAAGELPYV